MIPLKKLFGLFLFIVLVSSTGCSKFLGNLRRDLDDSPANYQPTTGGLWPERGMLSDDPNFDRYSAVGHSDRSPASSGPPAYDQDGNSWVNPDQADANARDAYRTYSQNQNVPPAIRRHYRGNQRTTRADFIDSNPNEGSLWASNGQTNYYFTKNKIRGVGDIVSITVEDKLVNDIASEVRNTLSPNEREFELVAAQERLAKTSLGSAEEKKETAPTATAEDDKSKETEKAKEDKDVREATFQDIDVKPNLDIKSGEVIMGEIVERYPNGNYKVRATKQINYRGGSRLLNLVGIAKSTDINETDVVASSKLYEYRLAVIR